MLSSSLLLSRLNSLSPSSLPQFSTSRFSHGLLASSRVSLSPNYKRTHLLESQKKRKLDFTCFCKAKEKLVPTSTEKDSAAIWPVLERWDVPWEWQTVLLSMVACGVSFVLTGLIEASALPYLGFQGGDVSLDEKAEILFAGQFTVTAVVLGVVYGITNTFQPLPDGLFRYDWKEPFNLRNGWLLWAGIGLVGAIIAIALAGTALTIFNGEQPQRETDALVRLLPLIGSSGIRFPTPVSALISAAVFALAHLTPGEFPQLFVLGTALGLSYAQTRNLLTPITIHALWNSAVILLLTFLQLQGYDIRELLQAS